MGKRKTSKRPLSEWNKFVMEVKKQNPEKIFKDVLVLAGQLKKKGVKLGDVVKNKTVKVVKKVKNAAVSAPKKVTNTLRKTVKSVIPKKQKKRGKTQKRKTQKKN